MEVTFGGDVKKGRPTRPSPLHQEKSEDSDGSGHEGGSPRADGATTAEVRGEEDLDDAGNGLSLISSSARAAAGNDGISGAYDAGPNATCPVEPFNLKAEREGGEGYFDGDSYVFRKLEDGGRALDEEPDAWLDGLGGRDADGGGKSAFGADGAEGGIARLSRAGTTSSSAKSKQPKLDLDEVPTAVICGRTAALLAGDKETVAGALKRYGDVISRDRQRRKKKQRKEDGRSDAGEEDEEGVAAARKALSDLTDLADAMLMGGDGDVYSRTKEELAKMAAAAGGEHAFSGQKRKRDYFAGAGQANTATVAESVSEVKVAVQWEYRGNEDQQTHGPYSTEQMMGWIQAGYFVGNAAVDVRRIAPEVVSSAAAAADVAPANDLMADLMDSDDDDVEGGNTSSEAMDDGWERSDEVDFASFLV